jgi:hypothetical protein
VPQAASERLRKPAARIIFDFIDIIHKCEVEKGNEGINT